MTNFFENWKACETGMICSAHPTMGGIIDKTIVDGEWFVIFNDDRFDTISGLDSLEDAKEAFIATLRAA